VATSEVQSEAIFRYAVAVITAALTPRAVIVIPRTGARLAKAAAHLPLVLWHAAMMDAPIGRTIGLDAAVIDAAVRLLRSFLAHGSAGLLLMLRRFVGLLLMWRGLLVLLRSLLPLLMFLRRLRFALLPTLLLMPT
jgi:hypothetical protein